MVGNVALLSEIKITLNLEVVICDHTSKWVGELVS